MGGSGFGVSFASSYGAKMIARWKACLLFGAFVVLGAALLGRPVAQTLGSKIVGAGFLSKDTVIIILVSAAACLLLANLIHIPQSTSLVTVWAIAGVGMYFNSVNWRSVLYMVPFWFLFPVLGYMLTRFLGGKIYPPRNDNFWVYEKLVNHESRLRKLVIAANCYNAFSVGANNVANAAGPLFGAGIMSKDAALLSIAPLFGIGCVVFPGALKTTGSDIVPLGTVAATIVCFVTGTLMIVASLLGVPQSIVMIKVACVVAIDALKNAERNPLSNPVTRKMYILWAINPVIAFVMAYSMAFVRFGIIK
jgi:sulfate permease